MKTTKTVFKTQLRQVAEMLDAINEYADRVETKIDRDQALSERDLTTTSCLSCGYTLATSQISDTWQAHNHFIDPNTFCDVSRIEYIDKTGRAFVRYLPTGESISISIQDVGRTLKIFQT